MKMLYLLSVATFAISCNQQKTNELNKLVQFDKSTGILKIREDKKHLIKIVEIRSDSNSKQNVLIDSTHKISEIQNVISVDNNSHFVNTWIGFDSQKNFDYSRSYYYETSLLYENDQIFVECYLPNLIYDNSRCYVLINDFDNKFRTKQSSDTLWFDEDYLVKIPVKKHHKGKNNIKFVIVEDELVGNRLKIKKTYVNKDFTVMEGPVSELHLLELKTLKSG